MAGMREIKSRIKSIKETQQITKAMKLISASKLKRAKQQLEQTKPYFNKVETTIAEILAHSEGLGRSNVYFEEGRNKEKKKTGIIILTGDKGMAGGYNHNIIKLAEDMAKDAEDPLLFVAGYMGKNYFSRTNFNLYEDFDYPVQNPTVKRAKEISKIVLKKFLDGDLDEVYLAYTGMYTSIRLIPQAIRLLPLSLGILKAELGIDDKNLVIDRSINYEPSLEAVFDVLIPKYIKGVIYSALVEAFTCEQSARMTAMDNATTNADEMLSKLNLSYNRARQAAITQEISEIVGGASAL
ncbi:MAG: ATP synthase F1 subunit gamma [Bacillota bacterium]|nr:ATP synthase F1 subunit gamma [Bacillota bacterium]